jgi:hypothetical protein
MILGRIKPLQRRIIQRELVTQDENEVPHIAVILEARRQRSEQYFTCSQLLAHAFRQLMGLPHCWQTLVGKLLLLPLKVDVMPQKTGKADEGSLKAVFCR